MGAAGPAGGRCYRYGRGGACRDGRRALARRGQAGLAAGAGAGWQCRRGLAAWVGWRRGGLSRGWVGPGRRGPVWHGRDEDGPHRGRDPRRGRGGRGDHGCTPERRRGRTAIDGLEDTPTALVSPTAPLDASPTPTPSPTIEPSPTATTEATATATPVTPSPTATTARGATATPTAVPTTAPTATATATYTSSPTATATHTPTRIPSPTPTATRGPVSTVQGLVWEQISPDAYQACPNCAIRLSGSGGVFTAGGSPFSIAKVPAGTYRVERVCGAATIPAQRPTEVTVPTSPINVEVSKCP